MTSLVTSWCISLLLSSTHPKGCLCKRQPERSSKRTTLDIYPITLALSCDLDPFSHGLLTAALQGAGLSMDTLRLQALKSQTWTWEMNIPTDYLEGNRIPYVHRVFCQLKFHSVLLCGVTQ